MNNVYNEPKYDTDPANKGYVDSQSQHVINVINGVEEDTNNKLNRKTQNFGSQPAPPYRLNDTWMNGTDIYICVNERLIGNFVASDWQKASIYDNTKSILDGGVTTDGTLVVAKGGTVAAGLTAYTSGDNGVRIWAGSDINGINSAPFRVTQAGYLYASNANISGTITATSGMFDNVTINGTCTINGGAIKTGTIAAARLDSSVITTTNFNAQNINANKITSGTLSTNRLESKVITTDNFSAQNINANKITSGAITTAGIDVANSTGFLRMLYANWANHPYVSALNVAGQVDYPNKNGTNSSISFRNEEFKENTGSQVGFITFGKLGDGIIGASGNLRLISNDQIYIGQLTIKGTTLYGDYSGSTSETDVTGKPYITQFNNTYINPRLYAYVGGKSTDSNLILTKGGSPSSKNLKTNIKLITEYENIYNDFKKINFYTYDYKYKGINDNNNDFGFIIDEIEENETLSKYYKNYSKEGYIDKDKNMFPKREGMIYENMEHINYKVWDRDAYLKMNMVLIKSLQNKIEELEKRIKEMEGNK